MGSLRHNPCPAPGVDTRRTRRRRRRRRRSHKHRRFPGSAQDRCKSPSSRRPSGSREGARTRTGRRWSLGAIARDAGSVLAQCPRRAIASGIARSSGARAKEISARPQATAAITAAIEVAVVPRAPRATIARNRKEIIPFVVGTSALLTGGLTGACTPAQAAVQRIVSQVDAASLAARACSGYRAQHAGLAIGCVRTVRRRQAEPLLANGVRGALKAADPAVAGIVGEIDARALAALQRVDGSRLYTGESVLQAQAARGRAVRAVLSNVVASRAHGTGRFRTRAAASIPVPPVDARLSADAAVTVRDVDALAEAAGTQAAVELTGKVVVRHVAWSLGDALGRSGQQPIGIGGLHAQLAVPTLPATRTAVRGVLGDRHAAISAADANERIGSGDDQTPLVAEGIGARPPDTPGVVARGAYRHHPHRTAARILARSASPVVAGQHGVTGSVGAIAPARTDDPVAPAVRRVCGGIK